MLELRDIRKQYVTGNFTQTALDGVSVAFRDNEFVAILGPSGSGKTTLLNVIGGLDHFDSGDLIIDGISTKEYKDRDWDAYRNNRIGFVFQSYNLIPHQTILENVELALTLSGVGKAEREKRAREALERVGLGEHVDKKPSQLSGGQMQRVAIARALINDPEIVLADEPTGALDSVTSTQVMDLLKDVAKDRLVIMVTHNPDLADAYATRIVRLVDGRITDDSDPFDPNTVAQREAKPVRKTSMSLWTAMGLSFRNLMTKKGRTIMTAIAGAIGIIGIAAILALSNGVNDYIYSIEEETLSSYPLTITSSSSSMSSMLSGEVDEDDAETEEASDSDEDEEESARGGLLSNLSSDDDDTEVELTDEIMTMAIINDAFGTMGTNDLESLREYLESDESDIYDYVNAIQYDYGITPLVYSSDTSDGVVQLNPNSLTSLITESVSSTSTVGSVSSSYTSPFTEMIDNQELLESEYEVVAGRWATEADECVLVLTSSGYLTDYILYAIGVLDPDDLDEMVSAMTSADGLENYELEETEVSFTYEDALNLTFTVISPAEVYSKNEETGGWTDRSDDDDYMLEVLEDGIELKVVGVVQATSSDSSALSPGIAYTHALTLELMERSASSEIVQQQLANPDVDVFTGETFEDLQADAVSSPDFDEIISIDEDAIAEAFSMDEDAFTDAISIDEDVFADALTIDEDAITSAFSIDEDAIANALTIDEDALMSAFTIDESVLASAIDLSSLDLSGLDLDLSDVEFDLDLSSLLEDVPTPDYTLILADIDLSGLSEDDIVAVVEDSSLLLEGFFTYLQTSGTELDTSSENFSSELLTEFEAYLATDEAQLILLEIEAIAGDSVSAITEEVLSNYVELQLAPYLEDVSDELMSQMSEQITAALSTQLEAALADMSDEIASTLSTQLASAMETAFSVDEEALASAFSVDESAITDAFSVDTDAMAEAFSIDTEVLAEAFNIDEDAIADAISIDEDALSDAFTFLMTTEDLASLLTSYSNASSLTYDNNLSTLGYAVEEEPITITIYPIDFDCKEVVLDILDDYNDQMEAAGEDDKVVSYTDYVGLLMSSVTEIVDMISMVLIAFVSISLVVSSIMIGVITYISVLERKKEIGILRALGASKGNVASVFNAETFIEGLISGVLAIVVVYIASVPVNAIVLDIYGVENIMQLPWTSALALIALSVLLTLVAGLVPASSASKKDPVEALRSE